MDKGNCFLLSSHKIRKHMGLISSPRFKSLFWVQFLGAFNDNLFKNAILILLTFNILQSQEEINFYSNLAGGLFILPFFLFSATFSQITEKYEKTKIIKISKLLEIALAIVAVFSIYMESIFLMFFCLVGLGLQATLFGPIKYSILPQHLKQSELLNGNALIETGTFLAILIGTVLGGIGIVWGKWIVCSLLISCSLIGYYFSFKIPKAPSITPNLKINWNPITATIDNIKFLRTNRTVFLSILGISWFWAYGGIFLSQFPNYVKNILKGGEYETTILLVIFSVGVGLGSMLCSRLSGKRIEIGLVPFGSIGLSYFGLDIFFTQPVAQTFSLKGMEFIQENFRVLFDLFGLGVFGGLFIVPLYSLIQTRSEKTHTSRVIGGNNILNALFMVLAAGLGAVALKYFSIPELFLIASILNACVAIYIYTLVPEFLIKFIVWIFLHTMYNIKVEGEDNIPEDGSLVVVCNHISFMDGLILGGLIYRPTRFVMYYKFFNIPLLSWFFKTIKAIPIAGKKEDEKVMLKAFDQVSKELKDNNVVGIFPEGAITKDGHMAQFRPGIEKIIERDPCPVIPMALQGMWGSVFSRKDDFLKRWRLPRRFRSKITLVIGKPIPYGEATAELLEQKVRELKNHID